MLESKVLYFVEPLRDEPIGILKYDDVANRRRPGIKDKRMDLGIRYPIAIYMLGHVKRPFE